MELKPAMQLQVPLPLLLSLLSALDLMLLPFLLQVTSLKLFSIVMRSLIPLVNSWNNTSDLNTLRQLILDPILPLTTAFALFLLMLTRIILLPIYGVQVLLPLLLILTPLVLTPLLLLISLGLLPEIL